MIITKVVVLRYYKERNRKKWEYLAVTNIIVSLHLVNSLLAKISFAPVAIISASEPVVAAKAVDW